MNNRNQITSICKVGKTATWINIIGVLTSGLLCPVLSLIFAPQPAWEGAELFARSYHPLQASTFFCGFLLVISSLLIFITLGMIADREKRIWAFTAIAIGIVFTAVVILNYIIQTTYIPYLASYYPPEAKILIPVLSMANPGSLAWAFEMYGWGGIGLSYLFMVKIFPKHQSTMVLRWLFIGNACSSVIAAFVTSIDMNWLFTSAGLASLVVWNSLILLIDFFLLRYFSTAETESEVHQNMNFSAQTN